jgi:hypothetical protein
VRDGELIRSFPLTRADQFDSRPCLISSNAAGNNGLAWRLSRARGGASAGDTFFLLTDALACWCLRRVEAGASPWDDLLVHSRETASFAPWITRLRDRREMRNDDVTVLVVSVDAGNIDDPPGP